MNKKNLLTIIALLALWGGLTIAGWWLHDLRFGTHFIEEFFK
jgi:hypothetical protein